MDAQAAATRTTRRSFFSQSAVGVVGNGISAIISVAYASFIGHMLSPADYGVVAAALSTGYFFSLLLSPIESGVANLAAQFHGRGERGGLRTLAFSGVRRAILPACALLLLWWPLAYVGRGLLKLDSIGPLLWLGALTAVSIPASIVRGVMRGDLRFGDYSVNQVVESLVRLFVGGSATYFGARAGGALCGYVVGTASIVGLAMWQLRDLRRAAPVSVTRGNMLSSSLPLAFTYLFLVCTVNLDILAAKHYLPAADAGAYGAAATLVRMLYLGTTPIYQVLFSHVAASHAQNRSARALIVWVLVILGAMLLLGLLIPIFLGNWLLGLLFGSAYTIAAGALLPMWLSSSLLVFEAALAFALIGQNRTRGAWAFAIPCMLMGYSLYRHHGDLMSIAIAGLIAVAAGAIVLIFMRFLPRPAARAAT